MRTKILAFAIIMSIPLVFNSCKDSNEEALSLTEQISSNDAFVNLLSDYSALKILAHEADPQLINESISQINSGATPDISSDETLYKAYLTMISIGSDIHELLDMYPALKEISDQERTTIFLEAAGMAALPAGVERLDPSLASQADLCTSMYNLAALGFLVGDIICFTDATIPQWICSLIHELGQWVLAFLDDFCYWCLNNPPCF